MGLRARTTLGHHPTTKELTEGSAVLLELLAEASMPLLICQLFLFDRSAP